MNGARGAIALAGLVFGACTAVDQPGFDTAVVQSGATTAHNGGADRSRLQLAPPAHAAGDLLLAQITVAAAGSVVAVCAPPGWTSIRADDNGDRLHQALFYRVAEAGDAAGGFAFRFAPNAAACAGGGLQADAVGGMLALPGALASAPILASASFRADAARDVDAPALAHVPADAFVVRFFGNDGSEEIGADAPPRYTARRGGLAPAAAALEVAQATGGTTARLRARARARADWIAQTVAIRSASRAPPVLSGVPANRPIREEALHTFGAQASTEPGRTIAWALEGAPAGAAIDPATGVFTWLPAEHEDGTYTFGVLATDDGVPALTLRQDVTLDVLEVNTAPRLDPLPDRVADAGRQLVFVATAADGDVVGGTPNTLRFALGAGAPAGASIDAATGRFAWTPGPADAGAHDIAVRVTDDGPGNRFGQAALSDERIVRVVVRNSAGPACVAYSGIEHERCYVDTGINAWAHYAWDPARNPNGHYFQGGTLLDPGARHPADRSNPDNAVGGGRGGNFFALGVGGWIKLAFPVLVPDRAGYELQVLGLPGAVCGADPAVADVYVAGDGTGAEADDGGWVLLGQACGAVTRFDLGCVVAPPSSRLATGIRYVKIVDRTADAAAALGRPGIDSAGFVLDLVGGLTCP